MGPQQLQTAIKRIVGDKILIAMVLAGMLILGVGVFCTQDDDKDAKKLVAAAPAPVAPAVTAQPLQPLPPRAPTLDPPLATDFVKWWLSVGMDYQAQSARHSHAEAFKWMRPDVAQTFKSSYWTPEIEAGVLSGQVVAAFQPVSVQAQAINPDGSVVVQANGTLVVQANGSPMTQQIATDFLITRDKDGLRIVGLYNRQLQAAANVPGSPY